MKLAAEDGGDDSYATFPVMFFDGEREIDIGNITVDASLEFRHFQSMLCNKIGIAPHQISVSLIRKKKSRSSGPRKISVTDQFNFGSIVNETHRDCFFVAVLKRSRRDRDRDRDRRSSKQNRDHNINQDQIYLASSPTPPVQRASFAVSAPEKVLLRRQSDSESGFSGLSGLSGFSGYASPLIFDYEREMRNLQAQRENYLLMSNTYTEIVKRACSSVKMKAINAINEINAERVVRGSVVCEECASGNGRAGSFHSCVYDAVTEGFRSPVGPIARPAKR
ncbi:hypothetical protein Scep_003415 [Stephania cephalantha]|uniref:DUF7138 domain-containing protein n=1 Tax=Stephania cephalantha TaxID=152367 RepID=A0AAP0KQL5_9MAGN